MRAPSAATAVLLVSGLLGSSAAAEDQLGAFLAGTCTACHQMKAAGTEMPALSGRGEADFVAVMTAFRTGARPEPIMQAVATSLSDSEMAALARYLASEEP